MTATRWRVPAVIAVVGLALTATVAIAAGVTVAAGLEMLLYSATAALLAGCVAIAVPRLARRRSLVALATGAALAPVLAAGLAVALAAHEMFLAPHDALIVAVVLVAATTLGLLIAVIVGWRVTDASRTITAMARRLADGEAGDPGSALGSGPDPRGPAELVALGRELETAAARLTAARGQARDVEAARRNLVAWVSHDLRTPLAGIRAMVEAIEDGVVDDAHTIGRYHATIRVEVDRLSALVDDLFELSRIEAGALRLDAEWVPLDELISDAVDASRAAARAVQLDTVAQPGPVVLMSPPEIVRVVRNLVDNAVRHTPAGGRVLVAVGGGSGTGPGAPPDADAEAWISVSDGCGGIPAAVLDRVFEPGFRGDVARTPTGRSGLGLAVAAGLVEAHGGHVDVHNTTDGCCFTIHFPPERCRPSQPRGARQSMSPHESAPAPARRSAP